MEVFSKIVNFSLFRDFFHLWKNTLFPQKLRIFYITHPNHKKASTEAIIIEFIKE